MLYGVIKKWKQAEGYGFIQGATKKPGPDLFFHATECIEPTPKVGERVVYRHGWDPKKQRVMAVEVRYEKSEHEERRRAGGRRRLPRLQSLLAPQLRAVQPHGVYLRLLRSPSVRVCHHLLMTRW